MEEGLGRAQSTNYVVEPIWRYRKYEQYGFGTPTRQVRYLVDLMSGGLDPPSRPFRKRMKPVSSPEVSKEYPLILTPSSSADVLAL